MSLDKSKRLNANLSAKRHKKLKKYAESRDKDVTSILEDFIDSLPNME
jgi:hypothetical protein